MIGRFAPPQFHSCFVNFISTISKALLNRTDGFMRGNEDLIREAHDTGHITSIWTASSRQAMRADLINEKTELKMAAAKLAYTYDQEAHELSLSDPKRAATLSRRAQSIIKDFDLAEALSPKPTARPVSTPECPLASERPPRTIRHLESSSSGSHPRKPASKPRRKQISLPYMAGSDADLCHLVQSAGSIRKTVDQYQSFSQIQRRRPHATSPLLFISITIIVALSVGVWTRYQSQISEAIAYLSTELQLPYQSIDRTEPPQ